MPLLHQRAQFEELRRELGSPNFRSLLESLRREAPALFQEQAWPELIDATAGRPRGTLRLEEMLRVIFERWRGDGNRLWRTVLLGLFWPSLSRLFWQYKRWDVLDPDGRWSNIQAAFMETLDKFDFERRGERIRMRVLQDTRHRLYQHYELKWLQDKQEPPTDPDDLDGPGFAIHDGGPAAFEDEEEFEAWIRELQRERRSGRVSEPEYRLVLGMLIYGGSLAEYCRRTGSDSEAEKKRLQRVRRKLWRP